MTLFVNFILRPFDACANFDLRRTDEWMPVIDAIATGSGRSDLLEKRAFLFNMRTWALSRAQNRVFQQKVHPSPQVGYADDDEFIPTHCDGFLNDSNLHPDAFPFDQWNWNWAQENEPVLPIVSKPMCKTRLLNIQRHGLTL
jgi:hypothetical protein